MLFDYRIIGICLSSGEKLPEGLESKLLKIGSSAFCVKILKDGDIFTVIPTDCETHLDGFKYQANNWDDMLTHPTEVARFLGCGEYAEYFAAL